MNCAACGGSGKVRDGRQKPEGFLARLLGRHAFRACAECRGTGIARAESPSISVAGRTVPVVDLRGADEIAVSRRSHGEHQRVAQQQGIRNLLEELVRLVAKDNSGFAEKARIREIGKQLNAQGGYKLMQQAYYHVRSTGIYFPRTFGIALVIGSNSGESVSP